GSRSRTAVAARRRCPGHASWRSKAWATTCLGGCGLRSSTRSRSWRARRRVLNELNPAIAFLAGLASFVSPCVLPLVPAYLAYLGSTPARAARSSFTSPLAGGGALSRPGRGGGFNCVLAGPAFRAGLAPILVLFFS